MHLTFFFSDAVKCINKPLTEKYSKKFNFRGRKIPVETFFSFIATKSFTKTGPNPQGPILCVGHPYNIKGVDVLLKAFNQICTDYPGVFLKIIGHYEGKKPYEDIAKGNSKISFHKGMFFNEIVTEFEECRFLVLPSRTESMGRVLIEAMACGKAVIGSRVGGIPEVIVKNQTGLLFESEDVQELADKMRLLLDNPDIVLRMGEAGYQRVKNHFSPEKYAELYHDFLESIESRSVSNKGN